MVAQKSQKDPKEYLPFLANLQSMDKYTQRYTIDAHLGRWDSALKNLAASGEDRLEEVIALMNKHSLYQTALVVSY
jgi:elongator complex protein 1